MGWVLGFQLLPSIGDAKEKWAIQGCVLLFGGLTGPPWSQMVDMEPLVRNGVGWYGWVG